MKSVMEIRYYSVGILPDLLRDSSFQSFFLWHVMKLRIVKVEKKSLPIGFGVRLLVISFRISVKEMTRFKSLLSKYWPFLSNA